MQQEFKEKGFIAISDLFHEFYPLIQKECEEKFQGDYERESPPFRANTLVHCTDLEDTFALRLMTENLQFISRIREITGIPDLKPVRRNPGEKYEDNVFSSKLALYEPGSGSFPSHFDRLAFEGDMVAVIYTVKSEGGAPLKLNMKSKGHEETVDLVTGMLTLHDASRVFHEVLKPDKNTRRIAYLMQFTNGGETPKRGLRRILSYLDVAFKTTKGKLGMV